MVICAPQPPGDGRRSHSSFTCHTDARGQPDGCRPLPQLWPAADCRSSTSRGPPRTARGGPILSWSSGTPEGFEPPTRGHDPGQYPGTGATPEGLWADAVVGVGLTVRPIR